MPPPAWRPFWVAKIELVVLGHETQLEHARVQVVVLLHGAALAAVGLKAVDQHAQRDAGAAAVAVRPVGEHSAAPEAAEHEVRVGVVVDQVAGRGHLRPGLAIGQVAARVGRRRVELQRVKRKILEVRHVD
jgi:hypothetical protein